MLFCMIFYLNIKLDSHIKYTVWHSDVITIDIDMLCTEIFCTTNGWQGDVSV